MMSVESAVSLLVWLLSLASPLVFGLLAVPVIAATTVNLWHQRRTLYNAGQVFEQRVNAVLDGRVSALQAAMATMVKTVEDIKDSQVKIAGAFRGRQLP